MIGQAMLAGAGFGLGAVLTWYGLRPPRPPLVRVLQQVRHRPQPVTAAQRRYRLLGAPLARLGLPGAKLRRDLALLGRDLDTFRAEQVVVTGLGALAVPVAGGLFGVGGWVPVWLSALGGLAGWRWSLARVQAPARRRREEMVHTLSVVQDLVSVALAGGAGIDQALDEACAVCTGWAAGRLRHTLHNARLTREPVWQALQHLGESTATPELAELAGAIRLAGAEGTRVRASLAAHAATVRARMTAAMEAGARAAGVRMSLPVLVLALSYGVFLIYPVLALMQQGLTT